MAHRDNVRPVRVAVDKDGVVLSCIGAEVSGYFLEWATWFRLDGDRLLGIRWQKILTLFTCKNDVVDIVINFGPVHNESSSLLGAD